MFWRKARETRGAHDAQEAQQAKRAEQHTEQPQTASAYIQRVLEQIRFSPAHEAVAEELRAHLEDQIAANSAAGDGAEAEGNALRQMGDAVLVGTELDRTHRPKPAWGVLLFTLTCLGAWLLVQRLTHGGALDYTVMRMLPGVGLMAAAYFLDFTLIGRHAWKLYAALMAAGLLAMSPFAPTLNGMKPYAIYVMLLMPLAFAGMVYRARGRGFLGILRCGLGMAGAMVLSLMIPSMACTLLLFSSALLLLITAVARGWFGGEKKLGQWLLVCIPPLLVIALAALLFAPYMLGRLDAMLGQSPAMYMVHLVRETLHGAKLVGTGALPAGVSTVFLNQDLSLALIAHKLGYAACAGVMGALVALMLCAYVLCRRQSNVLGRLVSTAVLWVFLFETVIYVLCNVGFMLIGPLSLPLISGGGTYLAAHMALLGVLLSALRTGRWAKDAPSPKHAGGSRVVWEDGRLTIDLRGNR